MDTMNEAQELIIRPEEPREFEVIPQGTRAAFEGNPYSHQTEPLIIKSLREAGALSLSLVAEQAGSVVGHIAFSKVFIDGKDEGWYGVGPLSVEPGLQRQGIGTALMKKSLDILRGREAGGCLLVGDPEYYSRFGFSSLPGLTLSEVPPENFMGLSLNGKIPQGEVVFHEAFMAGSAHE